MNLNGFCLVDFVGSKVWSREKHFHEKYKADIKAG
jgi:hypothetical protein